MTLRNIGATLLTLAGAVPALAQGPLPLKYTGPATVPAITAGDLMTRLYQYADDSMMGRRVGTEYNLKATAYIERELRRLGLTPAGDGGGYFQDIGVAARSLDTTASSFAVAGTALKAGLDYVAASTGIPPRPIVAAEAIMWGSVFDTIGNPTPEQYKGKVVVYRYPVAPPGLNQAEFVKTAGYQRFFAMVNSRDVRGRIFVTGAELTPALVRNAVAGQNPRPIARDERPLELTIPPRIGDSLFGSPVGSVAVGATSKPISVDARFSDAPRGGRNVIAMVRGTDAKLRGQYVVIGAHNDHIGFNNRPVDHDSLKLFNILFRPQGADSRNTLELIKDQAKWTTLNGKLDSIRKIRPSRPDSIVNGADDDGSGSMALLEMAEALVKGTIQPKRSLVLIWHTGEESGMWGSDFFARNPTVTRDSIVAQINIDMIGRGGPDDVTGQLKEGAEVKGDTKYVQLVGSRRLSKELGDMMETVNAGRDFGFRFDYALDANGHPQNIYCRSDHASYARFGIPVVFFTTGGHADYHQVTDEPQYIRYDHFANLTQFIFDASIRVANLSHRVKVDQAGPFNPNAACQQ